MKNNILEILNNPNYIKCWYPSSGDDFEITDLWAERPEMGIVPNLYILTDLNLDYYQNKSNTRGHLIEQGYKLVDDNINNSQIKFDHAVNDRFNKIDSNNITSEQLKEILILISGEAHPDILSLAEMGLFSLGDFLDQNPEYLEMPIELKIKCLEIINKGIKINYGASLYQKADKMIMFIQCDDVDFYEFCLKQMISIDSVILKRHHPEEWTGLLNQNLLEVFKELNTKSLLVYLNRCSITEKEFFLKNQIGLPVYYNNLSREPQRPDELIFSKW